MDDTELCSTDCQSLLEQSARHRLAHPFLTDSRSNANTPHTADKGSHEAWFFVLKRILSGFVDSGFQSFPFDCRRDQFVERG
ncbi:hypothetical protein D3H35_14330 [Cohnella faecalis]|uniref:Uncharacterized protein n=1 Tax=Cohnella faecalis TaxID=2315694 RepID=A0A398CFH6_9BACL|nr:hypothetical protein D3H35_14330 [Cohnella faecalis]